MNNIKTHRNHEKLFFWTLLASSWLGGQLIILLSLLFLPDLIQFDNYSIYLGSQFWESIFHFWNSFRQKIKVGSRCKILLDFWQNFLRRNFSTRASRGHSSLTASGTSRRFKVLNCKIKIPQPTYQINLHLSISLKAL